MFHAATATSLRIPNKLATNRLGSALLDWQIRRDQEMHDWHGRHLGEVLLSYQMQLTPANIHPCVI